MTSSFKNLTINDTGYIQLPSGTSSQRTNYIIETFTTPGTITWTAPTDVTSVEVLVIAGGGSGGSRIGGGGGAGGVVYNNAFAVSPGTGYTLTVGSGGNTVTSVPGTTGNNGTNSVFSTLTAIGGGGGGAYQTTSSTTGNSGGSGGGSGGYYTQSGAAGIQTGGFGNAGGGATVSQTAGGGGGGAGGIGGTGTSAGGGQGGNGLIFNISGQPTFYAAGGGGASDVANTGFGGSGIGGNAGVGNPGTGSAGAANTGSGGGGARNAADISGAVSGAGASGIIILRYKQLRIYNTVGTTTWGIPAGVTQVEVLVVAGGGGAGTGSGAGGGGAGGVIYNPFYNVTPGSTVSITVGAGGTGGVYVSTGVHGTQGGNSSFDALTAVGGGASGYDGNTNLAPNAGVGGSGAGTRLGAPGPAGTAGQGFSGGSGVSAPSYYPGGGGGGAGGPGSDGYQNNATGQSHAGDGGPGIACNITGVTRYYGGGGGSSTNNTTTVLITQGKGGQGGGGDGGGAGNGTAGAANTGGGGGGGGYNVSVPTYTSGGNGGSGIVIVSYNSVNPSITQRAGQLRFNSTTNSVEAYKINPNLSYSNLSWSAPDGLVCLLDAGNAQSYPGSGTAWYDLSGNNRHWTVNTTYAAWNNAGPQSYFNLDGTSGIATYANGLQPFIGPRSDQMGFGQEHTIICVTRVTASSNNFFFHFVQNPVDVNNSSVRLSTHMYYGGGSFYYDYPGCCNGQNRVYRGTQDPSWVGNTKIATWRMRRNTFPNRQFFRNNAVEVDSGTKTTGYANWTRAEAGTMGGAYNGRIYYIAFYNRALTDAELTAQWTMLTARYGIT